MMFSQRRVVCWMPVPLFLCFLVFECKGQGYKPAPTCARLECPPYTVVHTENEYEIRSYEVALWVSSPMTTSNSYKEAASKGFLILYDYFQGDNAPQVRINLTAPILTHIIKNTNHTIYFYMPLKYQNDLPPPVHDTVKPVKLPQHKYAAVRQFDGFLNDSSIATHIAALKMGLQDTSYRAAAAVDQFTVAGYDAPSKLNNRVNEVILWFD